MKKNPILRISILPLILFTMLAVSNLQPQKNNEKGQGKPSEKGKSEAHKGNDQSNGNHQGQENKKGQEGNSSQGQGKGNKGQGHDENKSAGHGHGKNQSDDHGHNKSNNQDKGHSGRDKNNNHAFNGKMGHGNGDSRILNGKRDVDLNWGFEDFSNRKRPGNQKKVTICHHTGGNNSDYPVTIRISENALQAHLNHGDQIGNCSVNYSDRWSSNYIQSRENVYNVYEQSWETMSYSEALLKYAAEKLLGIRTDLSRTRVNLTPVEIQRREALIYELQNNVNSLQNQLGSTRQRLDSDVNIIIQL